MVKDKAFWLGVHGRERPHMGCSMPYGWAWHSTWPGWGWDSTGGAGVVLILVSSPAVLCFTSSIKWQKMLGSACLALASVNLLVFSHTKLEHEGLHGARLGLETGGNFSPAAVV